MEKELLYWSELLRGFFTPSRSKIENQFKVWMVGILVGSLGIMFLAIFRGN